MNDLIQMVYSHFTLEGIQTYYEGQSLPAKVLGDRAEIKLFGPFIKRVNREAYHDLKVRIDLTLPTTGNVYNWGVVAQRYLDQANVAMEECWTLADSRVNYRGAIENLEFVQIEFSYYKES